MVVYVAILAIVGFLLILHRILESVLCSKGDAVRRKFQLEMVTALTLGLGWITMLMLTLLLPAWRDQWLGMIVISTPFILGGILFFSYLSWIVYHQETEKAEYEDDSMMMESQTNQVSTQQA